MFNLLSVFGPKTEASDDLKWQIDFAVQGQRLPMTYVVIVK